MGIFNFVKNSIGEIAIARPDDKKGLMVYKHPDPTIPNKAQLTVGADEVAVFFKDGQFVGQVGPGRHTLATDNILFLNSLIDKVTGGNVYQAQVWFITMREMAGFKFGGRIGDVEDPKSGLAIQTMVFGDYTIQVTDPIKLIQFFGLRSFATDDEFTGWFRQQLLKTIRDKISSLLVHDQLPLLNVTSGALNKKIEEQTLVAVQPLVETYGIQIARMGNFVISIKEEDEQTLKSLYKDAAQIRMAGGLQNYQQLAMGKAMMASGEGNGNGNNPVLAGAGLGVGMAMANNMMQQNQSSAQSAGPSLEERLKKLKALKEAGLIDEQEYTTKRNELLKEI